MSDTPQQQPGAGRAILDVLARLEAKVDRLLAQQPAASGAPGIASDSDLDSEWGNEEVKKNPKRWQGVDHAGRRMRECSPEFLDCLAEHFDYKAGKEAEDAAALTDADEASKKRKYSGYSRKSAARARGWAARLRAGWKPPAPSDDAGW